MYEIKRYNWGQKWDWRSKKTEDAQDRIHRQNSKKLYVCQYPIT